jgi:hypothetical protein
MSPDVAVAVSRSAEEAAQQVLKEVDESVENLFKWLLIRGIAEGSLISFLATVSVTTVQEAINQQRCQVRRYWDVLANPDKAYSYAPAVLYPARVRKGLAEKINGLAQEFYRTRDLNKVYEISSALFRHGLLVNVSTTLEELKSLKVEGADLSGLEGKGGQYRLTFYVGALPDEIDEFIDVKVAQGGASYVLTSLKGKVGPFKKVFSQGWAVWPLRTYPRKAVSPPPIYKGWTTSSGGQPTNSLQWLLNAIDQGASFFLQNVLSAIKIVSVWNLQYSIYYALNDAWSEQVLGYGTSPYVFKPGQSYHNDMYSPVSLELSRRSGPTYVSPTPAFGFNWLNLQTSIQGAEFNFILNLLKSLKVPGLPSSVSPLYLYFSPSYPDALPVSPLLASYETMNFIGTTTPIAYMQLTQAVVGAPVYFTDVDQTGTNCGDLYLVGFVDRLFVIAPPRGGEVDVGGQKVYLSGPGLSALLVRPPPSDWSLPSLLEWAKQNGVDVPALLKLIVIAFFIAVVVDVLQSWGVEDYCIENIVENWEPDLEDLKRNPGEVASELVQKYCPEMAGGGGGPPVRFEIF